MKILRVFFLLPHSSFICTGFWSVDVSADRAVIIKKDITDYTDGRRLFMTFRQSESQLLKEENMKLSYHILSSDSFNLASCHYKTESVPKRRFQLHEKALS